MKTKKALSIFLCALNVAGIICLIFFGVMFLSHDTSVRNPDAMIPFEVWESAGTVLTVGFFPLAAANTLAYIFLFKVKIKNPVRLLFFLPCVICLALSVSYFVISLI